MTEEVKKTKIKVICPGCDKPFSTNIGWVAEKGSVLTCRKCATGVKVEIPDTASVIEAIELLKFVGVNVVETAPTDLVS